MSVTGILIGVLMLVGSLARQDAARKAAVDPDQVAAYERILQTVRDLDEDYLVGKLPAEQYTAERARWMEQGAAHQTGCGASGVAGKADRQTCA